MKIDSTSVWNVWGSTFTSRQRFTRNGSKSFMNVRSGAWPRASSTVSQGISNSEPSIGSGAGHPPGAVLAGDADVSRLEAARGDEDGVEALGELAELHVTADVGGHLQLDVLVHDPGDVAVDDLARQPEGRDPGERRAAGLVERVVDRDAESELREVARRRQSRAPGPDDRDLLRRS